MVKAPPKSKSFGWKVCWDIIPTKMNLNKQINLVDVGCARCGNRVENAFHLLFMCSWAC